MTEQIRNFVESWFFDNFCRGKDFDSRDEFIDHVWNLYNETSVTDVESCFDDAIDCGLVVGGLLDEIKNLLSDFASDVVWGLYEDGELPDCYAMILDDELDTI